MRLHYETGTATFIQFVIGCFLSFIGAVIAIIANCTHGGTDCANNVFVSLLLIIFSVFGLGVLLLLGYIAQARRSPRLALVLIGVELVAAIIFAFDAKHALNWWETLSNLILFGLAAFVMVVAARLFTSQGARVVKIRSRVHR